ncbi:MAG TPA: ABC transporter substrate-binding protein [Vicinamibacterales bacterium]|nr:ABC transporter substrate-binding protein [Vicinamibacterales bacterium]
MARTPAAEPDATLRIAAVSTEESLRVLRSFLFAEGLLAFDWQGRLTARLATDDWTWEREGLSLRVRLRPDVRFHDNTPLTAPVAVAIIRQQIPKAGTRGFEAVESVEAVDDRTILFHLKRRDGFLLGALVNLSMVDDHKPNIGTGPFKLVPNKPGLEAVRNDSYYRGAPEIERVRVITYPTARASWAGLMRGDADMALEINKESVEFVEGAARFKINSSMQPFYIPLVFNTRSPILSRVEVRRAIADAIDRDEIAKNGMRGRGQAAEADDPVWPAHWAYNAALRRHTFNPSAARVRLDAAGLPVRPTAPGRRASRFQLHCIFYNEDPHFERIALLLQRQLAAVGIDLMLEGLKAKDLMHRISAGQFETYLFQLTSGRDVSWTYRFWHSPNAAMGSAIQNTGYTGADAALDQLRQALTEDDFRIAVGDLRQRFYEDVPAVFLAWTQTTRAVDSRFDMVNPNDPEIFANLWRWRVAPEQTASR